MAQNFEQLITKYHAFYEVSPYYLVIEEKHGSSNATRHMVQAGFDVDVRGLSNKSDPEMPPADEYAVGYAEIKRIARVVTQHASRCSVEAIAFPSTVFFEARRHLQSEAVLRIRISHCGGVDQRAGPPEQHALDEVEKQLQDLGLARR